MIGVALATGAGVFATSTKAGISDVFRTDLNAQLVVLTDPGSGGPSLGGFPPSMLEQLRTIPGVRDAVVIQTDVVRLGGRDQIVAALDIPAARGIFKLGAARGVLAALGSGEFVADEKYAKAHGLTLGDTLTMQTARGQSVTERLVAIYADNKVINGPLVSPADTAGFSSPFAQQGYLQVGDGQQTGEVRQRLDALFANNPEVTVADTKQLGTVVFFFFFCFCVFFVFWGGGGGGGGVFFFFFFLWLNSYVYAEARIFSKLTSRSLACFRYA